MFLAFAEGVSRSASHLHAFHKQDNSSGASLSILGDFLFGGFGPFAERRFVGEREQDRFVAVPVTFEDHRCFVGARRLPLKRLRTDMKRFWYRL